MDPGFLVEGVLRSVLGGRKKRSGRALRYLTGHRGGFWSNPSTLMTAAGLAWGIYETMQAAPPQAPTAGFASTPPGSVPPATPPLPSQVAPAQTTSDAQRIVSLAISAAYADGRLSDQERAAILQQANDAGVGPIVEQQLARPRPLAEIVAGITDPAQRATLYVLAFTIMRADEQVSGAERIYLAQLATLLGLDAEAVATLERDTGERIDALGDQGQLGG